MTRLRLPALLLVAALAAPAVAEQPRYETRKEHDEYGIGKFYMGREIAKVMGHQGIGWLERPEREKEEEPNKLLDALQFKKGEVVADVGAGSGYLSFRIAERVGSTGKVLAVDIQPEMLDIIRKRRRRGNCRRWTRVERRSLSRGEEEERA